MATPFSVQKGVAIYNLHIVRLDNNLQRMKTKSRSAITTAFFISGAENEIRTRDLNLGKVALYQLSYSRLRKMCIIGDYF